MPHEASFKQTIALIIEPGNSLLWGRVQYDDNLIVEEAATTEEMQTNMSRLLLDFHDLKPDSYNFNIEYHLG